MSGYHQLAKAETNSREYIVGLQSGTIPDDALAPFDPSAALDAVQGEIHETVRAFEKVLSKITLKGTQELKGEWTGAANEAMKAAEKLAAVVDDVKSSASSLAGIEPTPSVLAETVSSLASVAQASAATLLSSAFEALPTVPSVPVPTAIVDSYSVVTGNIGAVVEQATAVVDSAAEAIVTGIPIALEKVVSLASSVGEAVMIGEADVRAQLASAVTPNEEPLASQASTDGASVASVASSLLTEASQTVILAAGGTPSPTDLPQLAASLAAAASSKAVEVLAEVQETASSVLEVVSSSITSAAVVASSLAAPHPAFTDSASSLSASKAAHEEL